MNSTPPNRTAAARVGVAALIAGPVLFLFAEAITALAWRDPRYSYLYNWISDLGVPEPGVFQGRTIDSPLAWVMNMGFVIGGLGIFIGMLVVATTLIGRIRILTVTLGVITAVGYTLVGLMHTSTEAAQNGTLVRHFTGAFLAILGGNILAVMLGWHWRKQTRTRRLGSIVLAVGIIGLVAVVVLGFTAMSHTAPNGLIERTTVYTLLLSQLCAAAYLLRPAQSRAASRNVSASI